MTGGVDIGLQREHEALIQFLYLCPVGIAQLDQDGNVAMMNPVATQLLMPLASRGHIANLIDVLDPWAPTLRNRIYDHASESGTICENLRIHLTPAGREVQSPQVLSLTLIRIDAARSIAVLSEITRIVAQERELQEKEAHLRAIFDSVREFALYTMDLEGRILSWNRSGLRLKRFTESEVLGRHFSMFYPADHDRAALAASLDHARSAGWNEDEGTRVRKDGSRFWATSLTTVLLDEQGRLRGFTRVSRDITQRKTLERELQEMARTDHLTGIANRRHLCENAGVEVARWRRYKRPLSVLCMDIDHFKRVNDTYGHAAGDCVLQQFAGACRGELREVDLLGRSGGEEFVAVLPDTDAGPAREVAERIRRRVEELRVDFEGQTIRLTVSIGAARMSDTIEDLDGLLQAADERLYEAKAGGRNRVVCGP